MVPISTRRMRRLALAGVLIALLLSGFKLASFVHTEALSTQELSLTHPASSVNSTPARFLKTPVIVVPRVLPQGDREAQVPPTPERVRASSVLMSEYLLYRVTPRCPGVARVRGHVVLYAQINKRGRIEKLRLVSGAPMLAPSAIEAVKQWRYRPYMLNNQPVEVETTVDVAFSC